MPLGAVITGANADDGQQAGDLLQALVIQPPAPEHPVDAPDLRARPEETGRTATNLPVNAWQRRAFACVRPSEARRDFPASAGFAVPWNAIMLCFLSLVASCAVWTGSPYATSDGSSWRLV
jgi:hypothetical protein